MQIQVYGSAAQLPGAADLKDRVAVVIDVLRATSTIASALQAGARRVQPVLTPEEARAVAAELGGRAVLGGERGGLKIPGFDLGNSPLEYTPRAVSGRDVIITTTNGTRALHGAASAAVVCTAGFVNLTAVADFVHAGGRDVAVCCAGTHDQFSLDDGLCAGGLVAALVARSGAEPCDLGLALAEVFRGGRQRIRQLLAACLHGRRLLNLGFAADLDLCAQLDAVPVVPVLVDGALVRSAGR